MAITDLVDKISHALDNNLYTAAIFIDLSKAFDTSNHKILIKKLHHYGIRGIILKLIENYLTDRFQKVIFQDSGSELINISCGVPQGSILGPLLFLIYINDIHSCTELLQFILFADDTTIIYSDKNWVEVMSVINRELVSVANWFKANKLSLNLKKTNFIAFSKLKTPTLLNIYIDNDKIDQVNSTKFLGIEVDSHLTWNVHITKIERLISSAIGVLSRIKFKLSKKLALMVYNSIILPHLNYGNLIWASNYKTKLMRLYILQKRALRICSNSKRSTSSDILFKLCNTLDIFDINKMHSANFMYAVCHGCMPASICEIFRSITSVHHHNTRNQNNFYHNSANYTVRNMFIAIRGPIVWDNIPIIFKSCPSLAIFKTKFKKFLINTRTSK